MKNRKIRDARDYWVERLSSEGSVASTGHRSLGMEYNKYLYQRRLEVLLDAARKYGTGKDGVSVLELGCGGGFYVEHWKQYGATQLTGIDISENRISDLRIRHPWAEFFAGDITEANCFPTLRKYDFVTLLDVTYHLLDDCSFQTALQIAAKHLKDDGALIIFEQPLSGGGWQRGHIKLRSLQTIIETAAPCGLQLNERIKLFSLLSPPVFTSKPVSLFVAGAYMAAGVLFRTIPATGRAAGAIATSIDNWLEGKALRIPNHECLVFTKS